MKANIDTQVLIQELGFLYQTISKTVDKVCLRLEDENLLVYGNSKNVSGKTLIPTTSINKQGVCVVEFSKLVNVIKQLGKSKPETIVLEKQDTSLIIKANKNKVFIPVFIEKISTFDSILDNGMFLGTTSINDLSESVGAINHVCVSSNSDVYPVLSNINIVPQKDNLTLYTTDRFVAIKKQVLLTNQTDNNLDINNSSDILVSAKHFTLPKTLDNTNINLYLYSKENKALGLGVGINNDNTIIVYYLTDSKALPYENIISSGINNVDCCFNISGKDLRYIVSSIKQFDNTANNVVNINVGSTEIGFSTPTVKFSVDRIVTPDDNTCSIDIHKTVLKNFVQTIPVNDNVVEIKVTNKNMLLYSNDSLMVDCVATVIGINNSRGEDQV